MARKVLGRGLDSIFGGKINKDVSFTNNEKKSSLPEKAEERNKKTEEPNQNAVNKASVQENKTQETKTTLPSAIKEKEKKENISSKKITHQDNFYEEETSEDEPKPAEIQKTESLLRQAAVQKKNESVMQPYAKEYSEKEHDGREYVRKIPLDRIRPNMYQPRRNFDEAALQELAESIRSSGLLQPITVWKDSDREYYEIIAGERRMRAARMAGLKEVNAIIKENLSDEKKLELALIENIQREDLNAIDTAMAYKQLIEHFGISQADISRTVGKSRAAISNTLRLMELEENIRNAVRSGLISEGHARALLQVPDKAKRQEIFQRIVAEKLSVRETEAMAQNYHYELPADNQPQPRRLIAKAPEIIDMQASLSRHFGSKVEIKPGSNGKKGKIVISYYSLDDFDRITSILQRKNDIA
ncbi:MAG: ParB/RepB/Spo0J family partition protein [Elusimicrobiales bacterium]|nr:ParB/RepB/Spo0J family partition protein [Elusimicrobiales bacterium]